MALNLTTTDVCMAQKPESLEKLQITVVRFDIAPAINDFPATWIDTMMAETVDELTRTKKFEKITLIQAMTDSSSDAAAPNDVRKFRLTGTVVKYKPGNKTVRFIIGMGAGKTKITASVKLVDVETGKTVLEREVDGSVIKGTWGGGDSSGATRGVAVEIAKRIKKLDL